MVSGAACRNKPVGSGRLRHHHATPFGGHPSVGIEMHRRISARRTQRQSVPLLESVPMSRQTFPSAFFPSVLPGFLIAIGGLWGAVASEVIAVEPSQPIIAVEEDWELIIGSPDADSAAPQIRCVMSPSRDLESTHVAFTINHHTQPAYQSGGLQLQVWDGQTLEKSRSAPSNKLLSHPGEIIRWTQRMSIAGGVVTFEILNGSSTTWKEFGGEGHLKLTIPTVRTDFKEYHPLVSTANSEVGFAANRVEGLLQKEVRVYTSEGLLWQGKGVDEEEQQP